MRWARGGARKTTFPGAVFSGLACGFVYVIGVGLVFLSASQGAPEGPQDRKRELCRHAPLAQSAERFHGKEKVDSSILSGGSILLSGACFPARAGAEESGAM